MGTRGPYPGVCYGDPNQIPKQIHEDGNCAVKPRPEYDEAYDNMWTKVAEGGGGGGGEREREREREREKSLACVHLARFACVERSTFSSTKWVILALKTTVFSKSNAKIGSKERS